MTEKEKAVAGLLYLPSDEELSQERHKCEDLCFQYNQLLPSEREAQKKILAQILGCVKSNYHIRAPFHCDYGYNIEIGENFYANYNLVVLDCAKVTFGDNVQIAPNCGFYAVEHPLDAEKRASGVEFSKPITVGNNVWIGAGVTVLAGVTIGDNSVIGAGSVVTKDIPANVLAFGNPCRVIRSL